MQFFFYLESILSPPVYPFFNIACVHIDSKVCQRHGGHISSETPSKYLPACVLVLYNKISERNIFFSSGLRMLPDRNPTA